jgi:hypothetical protein
MGGGTRDHVTSHRPWDASYGGEKPAYQHGGAIGGYHGRGRGRGGGSAGVHSAGDYQSPYGSVNRLSSAAGSGYGHTPAAAYAPQSASYAPPSAAVAYGATGGLRPAGDPVVFDPSSAAGSGYGSSSGYGSTFAGGQGAAGDYGSVGGGYGGAGTAAPAAGAYNSYELYGQPTYGQPSGVGGGLSGLLPSGAGSAPQPQADYGGSGYGRGRGGYRGGGRGGYSGRGW